MKPLYHLHASTFKSRTKSWTAIGVMAALLFFLISGSVAYINVRILNEDNQQVVHTHTAITTLDDLQMTLQDAETGQRGFLLTADEQIPRTLYQRPHTGLSASRSHRRPNARQCGATSTHHIASAAYRRKTR